MAISYIPLRVHSEYSLVDGLIRVEELPKRCAGLGMPAVAVTDVSNLFSLVKFYKAATGAGVKPIAGADLWLEARDATQPPTTLPVLVMDDAGYRNLTELISRAHVDNQSLGRAVVKREWLRECHAGLIALSGGRDGEIGQALIAGHPELAADLLAEWQAVFGDRFYLEVARTGREHEEDCLHASVALALQTGTAVVATNLACFNTPDDFEAHEVRVCIHDGRTLDDPRRPRRHTAQQYLRAPADMESLFADLPEALANSVEIAQRCNLELRLGKSFLPDYEVPPGMTLDEFFIAESKKGLAMRLETLLPRTLQDYAARKKTYEDRLDFELNTIIQMKFPGYFLIVSDFIRWAKANGIPVGPGRGSGAGSLVAYALEITDLDPLAYELLFERFLNPERVSMPDFDIDFCMEGRDRVIDYVRDKYGHMAVSQIVTFGTMAARAVVRDVARAQGRSLGMADRVAKMIPFHPEQTLAYALGRFKDDKERDERGALASPELQERYQNDEEIRDLLDMSLHLEGTVRGVGKHAGGVVIAPGKLTDFSPLYCDEQGHNLVTQFDKDDVEKAGLVKFDFLGLRTLTIIDWAVKTINRRRGKVGLEPVDIVHIPLNDKPTFDLLKRADTMAVFQLESSGMRELIKKLKPDVFEDIVALVALFRPGPLQSGMADDFVNRKHGIQKVTYLHPKLEPILANTYGTILYQEQVMQIAQVLAGYTLGGADMLRRAMGKKDKAAMEKERAKFMEGAGKSGVDPQLAGQIFDIMEKFAEYGFNKSHSAAYALVSYQTAWLKAHFPAEFMAAEMSAVLQNTDRIVSRIDECKTMGLRVLPPDVNNSDYQFTVDDSGAVVYGLGAVKGVGEGPISEIVAARRADGAFRDLFDFCRRVRGINRRMLEALIRAGALDGLGPNKSFDDRATLVASLDDAIKASDQLAHNADAGIADMFGDVAAPVRDEAGAFVRAQPWKDDQRLDGERETLGLYLTGHPIDQYEKELATFISKRIGELDASSMPMPARDPEQRGRPRRPTATVAGLVTDLRFKRSKDGKKMGFITLDDRSGRLEVSIFPRVFEQFGALVVKDALLVIEGEIEYDDYSDRTQLVAGKVMSIQQARDNYAKQVVLEIDEAIVERGFAKRLAKTLEPFRNGRCDLQVVYKRREATATLQFGPAWQVQPAEELLQELRQQFGRQSVRVLYGSTAGIAG
ncbi:MAG: DNA polymerase III subunit alpha [Pseudomonadota bacterium]